MYGRDNDSNTGNAGTSGTRVPWSVRAEFTIHRADDKTSPVDVTNRSATIVPTTETTGVRMTYSFTPTHSPPSCTSPTSTMSPPGTYGFQRGNFMFTSSPPTRSLLPIRSHTIPRTGYSQNVRPETNNPVFMPGPNILTNYLDSGYNSEQLSHSSLPSQQPSDKRCKSTYNIILSTASRNQLGPYQQHQLHLPCPRPWSSFYQRHQQQQAHVSPPCCQFSVVPEVCEDCAETATPYTTHFCTRLSDRNNPGLEIGKVATTTISKDAASQTTDIEAQHSPVATRRKFRRKNLGTLTGSSGRDELKNNNFGRLSRTPASVKSPSPPPPEGPISDSSTTSNTTNTKEDSSEKRKRTVHIDVYCTGTDDDPNDEDESNKSSSNSNTSSSSSSVDESLTQTTVFEGTDVCITHTQAKPNELPRGFQDDKAFLKRAIERRCESFKQAPMRMPSLASSKGYESDEVLSSLYPSQFSSYSRLRDYESSVWSAASSSAGIADYDSTSNTSWKDTVSDMESLINSKANITPCDSFEYADSLDRDRIKRMEAMWLKKTEGIRSKNWRSPQNDRKHLLEGKVMEDYIEKLHPPVSWSSESSVGASGESDIESAEEVGWSFVSSEENASVVTGKLTLPPLDAASIIQETSAAQILSGSTTDQDTSQAELNKEVKTTIFRERIGPFGSISPSSTPTKFQSRVTSPFTTPQGEKTDHILKASIFGKVVNTFRKPGHHVGPAKNPSCSCEHCRRYFEESTRGRSCSLDTIERGSSSRAPSSTR